MNDRYQNAEMDVVGFEAADVIATSGAIEPGTTTQEWVPRDNEGAPDYDAFVDL